MARYVAKKLQYHHRLKQVLYPLKREFRFLGRRSKNLIKAKSEIFANNVKKSMKLFWKFILLIIYQIALKSFDKLYSTNFIYSTFNFFVLSMKLHKGNYTTNISCIQALLMKRWVFFILSYFNNFSLSGLNFTKNLINMKLSFSKFTNWHLIINFLINESFINKSNFLSTFDHLPSSELLFLKLSTFHITTFWNIIILCLVIHKCVLLIFWKPVWNIVNLSMHIIWDLRSSVLVVFLENNVQVRIDFC